MQYQFNENGEVCNVEPIVDQKDFRIYPVETTETAQGQEVKVQLCADLVDGRWEYFYSNVD